MQNNSFDPLIGQLINGKYEILDFLGSGGLSRVYHGRNIEDGSDVAVKILKNEYTGNGYAVSLFNKEPENVAALKNDHIVKIYDYGNDGTYYFIVSEYIDGITLAEYIKKNDNIEWKHALQITIQVLIALDAAHKSGIIHRDVKPQNIMIANDGVVKLSDFGIAKIDGEGTVHSGDAMYTISYASPEQLKGRRTDSRSDIYSLGLTMYEMIAGALPFTAQNEASAMNMNMTESLISLVEVDPSIPVGVSDLVKIATLKDPQKRFQSAAEMLVKIKSVVEHPDTPLIEDIPDDTTAFADEVMAKTEDMIEAEAEQKSEDEDKTDDGENEETDEEITETKTQRTIRIVLVVLTCVVAVMLSVAAGFWVHNKYVYSSSQMDGMFKIRYSIKDYVGHDANSVSQSLEGCGIIVVQSPVVSDDYPAGYIVSQSVPADTELYPGDQIVFEVSAPEDSFVIKDYVKSNYLTARQELSDLGIEVNIQEVTCKGISRDLVVRMNPKAGTICVAGDTVTLFVSNGTMYEKVKVPDLVGKGRNTLAIAYEKLASCNLKVGNIYPSPGSDITELTKQIEDAKASASAARMSESPDETASATARSTRTPKNHTTPPGKRTESPYQTEETPAATDEISIPDEGIWDYLFDPFGIYAAAKTEKNDNSTDSASTQSSNPTSSATRRAASTGSDEASETPAEDTSDKIFAGEYIVAQYPPAGTELYEWETVDLYFYSYDEISAISGEKTVTLDFPADTVKGDDVGFVYIKYSFSNGVKGTSEVFDKLTSENFPLNIYVPFKYGSSYTIVDIYVNDTQNIYKRIYVSE